MSEASKCACNGKNNVRVEKRAEANERRLWSPNVTSQAHAADVCLVAHITNALHQQEGHVRLCQKAAAADHY